MSDYKLKKDIKFSNDGINVITLKAGETVTDPNDQLLSIIQADNAKDTKSVKLDIPGINVGNIARSAINDARVKTPKRRKVKVQKPTTTPDNLGDFDDL